MTEGRKIQVEVGVGAQGAREGAEEVKQVVGSMAQSVVESGKRASKAMDGIGAGSEAAAKKLDRDTRTMVASIQRATVAAEAGERGTRKFFETVAASKNIGAGALDPYISQLEAVRAKQAELDRASRDAATASAFVGGLRDQIAALREQAAMYGKSADEVLRYKAAQAGAGSEAGPLIAQLQSLRTAHEAVTNAARAEAVAERDAAQASTKRGDFVASLKSQSDAIGKTRADLLQMQAAQLGVSDAAAPYIARLRDADKGTAKLGMSAAATAAAMRNVPAQFTDIIVSLQGGQKPLTVLLQQGGQLKDMFGGVGSAFKAMGTYLLGLVNPFTVVAAAVAAVGYVLLSGEDKTLGFNRALLETGNAAGLTAQRMGDMSKAIAASANVTQGAASSALTQVVSSGQIAATSILTVSEAAASMEKATGLSVDKTIDIFKKLSDEPTKASAALNEQYHYLTASVYEQIKALEQQGDKTGAVTLATNAYAGAIAERTPKILENLSRVERAWNAIKEATSNASATVGKFLPGDGGLSSQIATMQEGIKNMEARAKGPAGLNDDGKARLERAKTTLAFYQEQQGILTINASLEAKAARDNATAIAQSGVRESYLSARKGDTLASSLKAEDVEYKKALGGLQAGEKGYDDLVAAHNAKVAKINEQFRDKKGEASGASNASAYAQQVSGIKAQIDAEDQLIASLREHGAAAEKVSAGDKLVAQIQQQMELSVQTRSGKQTDAQLKVLLGLAQELAARDKVSAALEKQIALDKDYQGFQDKNAQGLQSLKDSLREQTDLLGKSGQARTIAAAQSKIMRDAEALLDAERKKGLPVAQEQIDRINDEAAATSKATAALMGKIQAQQGAQELLEANKKFAADSILDETDRAKALVEIDADTWRERIRLAGDGTAEQKALSDQFNTYYANQLAKPHIDEAKKMLTDIDNIFQQSFVDMTNGGKSTWATFTKSLSTTFKTMVANEIYKAFLKPIVVNIVGSLSGVTGLGGSSGVGGGDLLSGLASFLGLAGASGNNTPSGTGGGNLGGLGTLSNANTLFGVMKSGFGGISDTIASALGHITGGLSADSAASVANVLGGDKIGNLISLLGGQAGGVALDTAATAAATAAQAAAAAAASQTAATASTMLIEEGLSTAASAAASTAATAAAGQAASGLGAQLASKLVASWPVALAYAIWQNDKMYKDGVRYKDMDVTGVGSVVNAPMKFVDDTLNKIGLSGRVANLLSGLAISAMVWGKNGMFGGETRYGSGPYVGYSTDNQVQGEGGPSGGDPNLESTKAMVQKNYDNSRDLITALGGTADALYMFNDWELSPKKGNSFVRSVVRNDAGDGGPDFDNRIDLDTKDYADVMAAYVTEMKRSMLAAVANSNVSSVYKDYLANNGDLKTADDATLTGLMAGIQKIQAFSVALKELPFANMRDLTLDAAMSLANFMGGLDKFQTSMDSYFNNYYSDSEKFNKLTTDMTRQFANIGLDLPTSKAQFRQMAEALDLSTKSGRDTYVAMMNLQQGFSDYEGTVASVADAITQAAQQQQAASDQLRQSMTGDIQAAYDRESSALQDRISNMEAFIDTLNKLKDSLNLGDLSPLSPEQKLAEAKRQYESTLAAAKGGDEGAQGDLATAAQNYLDASKGWNASSEAYAATFNQVQSDIAGLQGSTETALSVAKQQLDEMKKQVDGILKLNDSVLSLADALAAFGNAFGGGNAYMAANPDVYAAYQKDSGGLTPDQYAAYHYSTYGAGEGRGQAGTGSSMTPEQLYLVNNPDVAAAYRAGNGGGMTPEEYADYHYAVYGVGEGRSFAVGTNFVPNDMTAQIHKGERIIPAADNRMLMDRLQGPNDMADVKKLLASLGAKVDQTNSRLDAQIVQQAAIADKDTGEHKELVATARKSALVG
jgi:phage-related minor tail protein